jgi:phage gp36-like protein
MPESITYLYTSRQEIERLIGYEGASAMTDDTLEGESEEDVWQDAIEQATDEINLFLEKWYDPSDMAENKWIRHQASWIAAYLLSQRRGNPALYERRYERILLLLEEIHKGYRQVPRLPWKADFSPAMDNVVVDHRYHIDKIRVQGRISSTGTPVRPMDTTISYNIE